MAREHSLNVYLYFEAVARRGTITLAAEELSVSPSAVSQQIKALEQQLGVRLFRRDGRTLSLTLEGEQLFHASAAALRMLREARRSLAKARTSRRLTLRVTPSFGVRWLGPRLSQFVELNPDWELRVDAAPDPTDFEREIMDFDIRYGFGTWAGLHCAPVLHDHVLPLCSPAYLATLPQSDDPQTLMNNARLIDSARALCRWDAWLMRNNLTAPTKRMGVQMDRSSMALQMAVDGTGIVLESLALASREVLNGDLVPCLPSLPVMTFPAYWLVCPPRYLSRRTVKLFLDWLGKQTALHQSEVEAILKRHELRLDTLETPQDLLAPLPKL